MSSLSLHRTVAEAGEKFQVQLFNRLAPIALEAIKATGKGHRRSCPLKAPLVLSFVVLMALFRSRSLAALLMQLLSLLRDRAPDISLRAVTTEAMCHARDRLGVEPVRYAFEQHAASLPVRKSYRGLRVWAVDGSKINVQDTPSNEAGFGRPKVSRGTAAFPQMLMVTLTDTASRCVRAVRFLRGTDAEAAACLEFLDHLGPDDVLLLDRGFASAWLFEECERRGIRFVCRISNAWKPKTIEVYGPGDARVRLMGRFIPSPSERSSHREQRTMREKPEYRMVEYRIPGGETIRVLTNLWDPQEFPAQEIAELYHQRWEVEIAYDEIKTHLGSTPRGTVRTVFRSKSTEGVLQEAYGFLLTYNLIRELMLEAALQHEVPELELSFVQTVELLRISLPEFERVSGRRRGELRARLLEDIANTRLGRPRRPISTPRVLKQKVGNFPLRRPNHKGVPRDFTPRLGADPPAHPPHTVQRNERGPEIE